MDMFETIATFKTLANVAENIGAATHTVELVVKAENLVEAETITTEVVIKQCNAARSTIEVSARRALNSFVILSQRFVLD